MRVLSVTISVLFSLIFAVSCSGIVSGNDSKKAIEQDKYEAKDDNFYRTSNIIQFGKSNRQTHSIYDGEKTANDKDYIVLNATKGKSYNIQTWPANDDSIDTILELQTETGIRKQYSDDEGDGTLSLIDWWECDATGLYYLIVSGRKIGWYGIDVEEFNGAKITVFPYSENFDDTLKAPWTNWVQDSFISYSGGSSIKTANIGDGKSTDIQLLADIPASGKTLTFYWQVNSEAGGDYFMLYIDGKKMEKFQAT